MSQIVFPHWSFTFLSLCEYKIYCDSIERLKVLWEDYKIDFVNRPAYVGNQRGAFLLSAKVIKTISTTGYDQLRWPINVKPAIKFNLNLTLWEPSLGIIDSKTTFWGLLLPFHLNLNHQSMDKWRNVSLKFICIFLSGNSHL